MSLSDWSSPKILRRAAALLLVFALPLASACTVRPLYSNPASDGTQAGVTADLSSIAIKPVETRYAQEVRNHLIFLFNGGAGQPAAARLHADAGRHRRARIGRGGAGRRRQRADRRHGHPDGALFADRARPAPRSSPTAAARSRPHTTCRARNSPPTAPSATRENRAARELAELLNLAIAQDLSK